MVIAPGVYVYVPSASKYAGDARDLPVFQFLYGVSASDEGVCIQITATS